MCELPQPSRDRRRFVFGCVLLVLSIVPWVVAPFTPMIGLPAQQLAGLVALLVIVAEITGAAAVAVLGRDAYLRITRRWRRHGNLPGANTVDSKDRLEEGEARNG